MSDVSVEQAFNTLQLIDVVVDQINMQNMREVEPAPDEAEIRWRATHNVAYRMASPDELRIRLHTVLEYDEDSPKPFSLEAALVGIYRSVGPISPDRIPSHIQTHSLPLLLPYMRELVANLTLRAGGPPLVIPTLALTFSSADENGGEQMGHPEGEGTGPGSKRKPSRKGTRKGKQAVSQSTDDATDSGQGGLN